MVAVVVQSDITEAIPLLNDNGSGVYIAGRNTASEFRNHFIGGLVGKSAGATFTPRSGVLGGGLQSGAMSYDLKPVSTGGAGTQAVSLNGGRAVIARGAQGAYWVTQTGVANVPAPAADASNPRIDILAMMPYDKGPFPADSTHGPKFIWITGDPSGAPVIPAIPAAVTECLPLCRILRGVNDNTIADADITDLRKSASLHGAPRHLLPGDALADAGGYHGEIRRRPAQTSFIDPIYTNAGYTMLDDRWDAVNNTWRGTQPLHLPKPVLATTASLGGAVTFTLATISIPDPGWPYRIDVSGSLLYAIPGGSTASLAGVYIQFNLDDPAFAPGIPSRIISRGPSAISPSPHRIITAGRYSTVLTGAHIVYFIIRNDSAPSNFLTWGDNEYAHCSVSILPA